MRYVMIIAILIVAGLTIQQTGCKIDKDNNEVEIHKLEKENERLLRENQQYKLKPKSSESTAEESNAGAATNNVSIEIPDINNNYMDDTCDQFYHKTGTMTDMQRDKYYSENLGKILKCKGLIDKIYWDHKPVLRGQYYVGSPEAYCTIMVEFPDSYSEKHEFIHFKNKWCNALEKLSIGQAVTYEAEFIHEYGFKWGNADLIEYTDTTQQSEKGIHNSKDGSGESDKKYINLLLSQYAETENDGDLNAHMGLYTDKVNFYGKTISKEQLREKFEPIFSHSSSMDIIIDDINIKLQGNNKAVAEFNKYFRYIGLGRKDFCGEVRAKHELTKTGDIWLTSGVSEINTKWVEKNDCSLKDRYNH